MYYEVLFRIDGKFSFVESMASEASRSFLDKAIPQMDIEWERYTG